VRLFLPSLKVDVHCTRNTSSGNVTGNILTMGELFHYSVFLLEEANAFERTISISYCIKTTEGIYVIIFLITLLVVVTILFFTFCVVPILNKLAAKENK